MVKVHLEDRLQIKDYTYWNIIKESFKNDYVLIRDNPSIIISTINEYLKYKDNIKKKAFNFIEEINSEIVKEILRNENLCSFVINLPKSQSVLEALVFESMAVGNTKISSRIGIQVFISYAIEEEEKAGQLYDKRFAEGFKPWMYKKVMLRRTEQISEREQAIAESDFFLFCVSKITNMRHGLYYTELSQAQNLSEKVKIIAVRFDDIDLPEQLR